MIRPKLLLCAEGVIIDQASNNISAFNVFEQINPPNLPIVIPKLVVLAVLERNEDDPSKWNGRLHIDIAGSSIIDQPLEYDFQDKLTTRVIFTIGGFPITQPGIMEISVVENDRKMTSYSIIVAAPPVPKVETSQSR